MKVTGSAQVSTRLKFSELQFGVLYIRYYGDNDRGVGFKVAVDNAGDQFLTLENISSNDCNHVFQPGYKDTFVKYNGTLTLENE